MSFIFISYSRQDQAYVSTLVQALQSDRLPIWMDDRIDYGSTWPKVIQQHLKQCSVFLVVMSPRSEDSHWVQCELSLALQLKKPIFPLLLEGELWLSVAAIQCVDVVGGRLPPARFFDAMRRCFPIPVETAESLPVRAVVAEQILPSPTPPVKMPTKTAEVELKSEKGVDYKRLQALLKAQDWRAADQETAHRMLKAVERNENDWIREEELEDFPCADLRTIDCLWVKYSNGQFGFSVQKQIYVECGAQLDGQYPGDKVWYKFCRRVGWMKEDFYVSYFNLVANPQKSPAGEFPAIWWLVLCGVCGSLLSHPDL